MSVLVAHLASEECTTTGEVLHAAGGRYARVRYMESRARSSTRPDVAPLAARWDDVMDMEGARLAAPA